MHRWRTLSFIHRGRVPMSHTHFARHGNAVINESVRSTDYNSRVMNHELVFELHRPQTLFFHARITKSRWIVSTRPTCERRRKNGVKWMAGARWTCSSCKEKGPENEISSLPLSTTTPVTAQSTTLAGSTRHMEWSQEGREKKKKKN